eukprot:RCo007969
MPTEGQDKVLCLSGVRFVVPGAVLSNSRSALTSLVSETENAPWAVKDPTGAFLIERPAAPFPHILNYLLFGVVPDSYLVCREILPEVDFYCLTEMREKMLALFPLLGQPYDLDPAYLYGLSLCNTSHMPFVLRFSPKGKVSVLERDSVIRHGEGCYMWWMMGSGSILCDPRGDRVGLDWAGPDGNKVRGTIYSSMHQEGPLLLETDSQLFRLVKLPRPVCDMEECFMDSSKKFR